MSLQSRLTPEQVKQVNAQADKLYYIARRNFKLPLGRKERQAWREKVWGRVARQILKDAKTKTPEQIRLAMTRGEARKRRAQMAKKYNLKGQHESNSQHPQ